VVEQRQVGMNRGLCRTRRSFRGAHRLASPVVAEPDIRPVGPPESVLFVDGLPVPVRLQRDVADAAERAGAFVELAIDLDIPRRAVRVPNDQIDLWAQGRLRVETSGDRLALLGRITVNEGSVDFIGRSFVIDPESAVIFDGREGIDPSLDISAPYSLADVDLSALGKTATASDHILLKVTGRLSKPKPDFTAVPDLSQTDILAIIAVGFPVGGDGASAQSNTGRVGNMLMNLVSAQASRILQDRLPVDVFKVEAGADDISKSKITVGKRLLRDLILSYNANFGAKDGENKNEAQLRFEITNNVQLEARYGDAGYGGADVFLLWRF